MLCQRYHFGWDPHAETDKVNNKLCALVVLSCTSGLLQAEFYHAVDDRGQTVRLVRPNAQFRLRKVGWKRPITQRWGDRLRTSSSSRSAGCS